jgi:hypothetical protein
LRASPKVRFFFWLALHGRCWTANRRMRHGLQDDRRLRHVPTVC